MLNVGCQVTFAPPCIYLYVGMHIHTHIIFLLFFSKNSPEVFLCLSFRAS